MRIGSGNTSRRFWVAAAVIFAGGIIPGTCQLRVRNALVEGTKLWVQNIFDPSGISDLGLEDLVPTDDETAEDVTEDIQDVIEEDEDGDFSDAGA